MDELADQLEIALPKTAMPGKQAANSRKPASSTPASNARKPKASGRKPAAGSRKAGASTRKTGAGSRKTTAGPRDSAAKRSKQTAKFVVSHGLADAEIGLFDTDVARQSEEAARFGGKPDATRIDQAIIDAIDSAPVELTIAPAVAEQEVKFAATNADQAGGIEILIKLATSGEIDPKNIDIIDVTDKFLKAIAAVPKENLRQSGKILFHASVLLRMKAEAMLAAAVAVDAADDFIDFDEDDGSISSDLSEPRQLTLLDLERALVRKANNRQNRQRKVTLDQLIDALREAEKIEKTRQAREPRQRIELAGQHEANDVGDLLDLAHDEDIEDTISRVEQILASAIGEGELVQLLRIIQLLGGHGDWVDAFLAVLFLSNAGKLTLEQKEFYGPLFVVRGDAAVESINVAM